MKKIYVILISTVLVVWLFASGLIIGTSITRNKYNRTNTPSEPVQSSSQIVQPATENVVTTEGIKIDIVTDVAPVTSTQPTESFSFEMPTNAGNITTYKSETEKQLSVPSGNKEIGEALVSAVNSTKSMKGFTATATEKADFVIDSVTGGNAVKNVVEGLINKMGNKPETVYSFSNGVDNNGSAETPTSVIAPSGKSAYINEAAIKSASAQPNAGGGYDIVLVLNDETQTKNQHASNHDGLFDTLDMDSLSLPSGFKASQLNFSYTNAEIRASVNSDGRLDSISYSLPISQGTVEGSMLGATVAVALHGVYSSSVTMTY